MGRHTPVARGRKFVGVRKLRNDKLIVRNQGNPKIVGGSRKLFSRRWWEPLAELVNGCREIHQNLPDQPENNVRTFRKYGLASGETQNI